MELPRMQLVDTWTHQLSDEDAAKVRQFLQGMLNRMSVSHHKYGPLDTKFPHVTTGIDNAHRALLAYDAPPLRDGPSGDGNLEHMIDGANYLMIEFMRPSHRDAHFTPTDSDGSLGYVLKDGTVVDGRSVS